MKRLGELASGNGELSDSLANTRSETVLERDSFHEFGETNDSLTAKMSAATLCQERSSHNSPAQTHTPHLPTSSHPPAKT